MKITLGNKPLLQKPRTPQECTTYFKDLKFQTGNFNNESIEEIISNGYTITYLYKDNKFDRSNHYMSNNYLGTQFLCIDIDRSDICPAEFIKHVEYKPSVIHTTFSNLTEFKDYKYCFHLLYFFDNIIYGEDNFKYIFNVLTENMKHVDDGARDCHRVIFTSNSSLPTYEYYDYGITYKESDFIKESYDNINSLFEVKHESKVWDKISSTDKSYSSITTYKENTYLSQNPFNLNSQFLNDMYSMSRSEFIHNYSFTYPYITETYISPERYENGYVDLRNEDYYVVPTAQYRWDIKEQRAYIPKIKVGFRNKMLWLDAVCFMKIVPNITKEYLVYLLTTEVYRNFENPDQQMSNMFIINKCKEVWDNIDNIKVKPIKRSFKIDKDYWRAQGMDNWLSITNHIRKQIKCNDFEDMYDCSMTIEQNIKEFRKFGVKTTAKTLIKWLVENDIPYTTDKEMRDKLVIKLYEEDTGRSSRDIEKLCKKQDTDISYRTVQRILFEYKRSKTCEV